MSYQSHTLYKANIFKRNGNGRFYSENVVDMDFHLSPREHGNWEIIGYLLGMEEGRARVGAEHDGPFAWAFWHESVIYLVCLARRSPAPGSCWQGMMVRWQDASLPVVCGTRGVVRYLLALRRCAGTLVAFCSPLSVVDLLYGCRITRIWKTGVVITCNYSVITIQLYLHIRAH